MTKLPNYLDYDPDDIDVRVADLIVATHDAPDPLAHPKISEALGILRRSLHMDVVFVSQFSNHRRTFKVVDVGPGLTKVQAGHSDPLEETWCHYVVEGRLPEFVKDAGAAVAAGTVPAAREPIGTYLSTPIRLQNGEVYGTLCCFSHQVVDGASDTDLGRLRSAAKLLAQDLHQDGMGGEMTLEPLERKPM
jgi:GAF domain-containing protein